MGLSIQRRTTDVLRLSSLWGRSTTCGGSPERANAGGRSYKWRYISPTTNGEIDGKETLHGRGAGCGGSGLQCDGPSRLHGHIEPGGRRCGDDGQWFLEPGRFRGSVTRRPTYGSCPNHCGSCRGCKRGGRYIRHHRNGAYFLRAGWDNAGVRCGAHCRHHRNRRTACGTPWLYQRLTCRGFERHLHGANAGWIGCHSRHLRLDVGLRPHGRFVHAHRWRGHQHSHLV